MERKYNIVIGCSFDGKLIAYRQNDKNFYLASGTSHELENDSTFMFSKKEIVDLKNNVDSQLNSYIDQCTFKLGQAELLKNPFDKQ